MKTVLHEENRTGRRPSPGTVPYEKPQLCEVILDYSGFLCASIFSMTGTITGHETGSDVDMSEYSLFSDWEGGSN